MSQLLRRLLAVGAEPDDDEDTRSRKLLLLVAALAITPLAVAWGAIYWLVGDPGGAAIPWLYVVISLASLVAFRITRSYRWFAVGQFAPCHALASPPLSALALRPMHGNVVAHLHRTLI